MKNFSATVKLLISQPFYMSFLLLEIGPSRNGNWLRMTTLGYDVTFDGNVYTSKSLLNMVDPPKISTIVDREAYKIGLSDPDFTLRPYFEEGLTNAKLSVRAGFINTETTTLSGYAPGEAILSKADTIIGYSGFVDSYSYTINGEGDVQLTIESTSPMGALGLTRSIITSKEWMSQHHPSDTSYDQVFIGSGPSTKKWGKA